MDLMEARLAHVTISPHMRINVEGDEYGVEMTGYGSIMLIQCFFILQMTKYHDFRLCQGMSNQDAANMIEEITKINPRKGKRKVAAPKDMEPGSENYLRWLFSIVEEDNIFEYYEKVLPEDAWSYDMIYEEPPQDDN